MGNTASSERTIWDNASDRRLAALWSEGLSMSAIAARIDRRYSAVQSRASKLGLRRQGGDRVAVALQTVHGKVYWTRSEDDRLRLMIKDRASKEDAARALGRSLDAVATRWKWLSNGGSPRVGINPLAKMTGCLRCRTEFWSDGQGNRHCGPCREYNTDTAWQPDS